MKHTLHIVYFLAISVLVNLSAPDQAHAQVSHRDTLLKWTHFDYSLDADNGMDTYSTTNIVEEEYPGVVLENEYVRLVVLPEFGARIISFLYKPTGHEQFYTNPVGTPYGMGDGNFYYDWLMVFGGVFPTFPEPEHGKTWFLPWQWELTEVSEDRISLKMEIQDTINYPGHPWKFDNGMTEVRCTSVITLEKGETSFEFVHTLQNTKAQPVTLEYWTCTTLAPGSEPGNTYTPANSEIIAPIDYVYLKDDWWSWMGTSEVPAPEMGSHVFNYDNLAIYDNWEDMGIAYAFPEIAGGYYGVINHENSEGVFRVADNLNTTPGMKFWTWGAEQGLNADPQDFYENARPYIELWSGLSTQFFEDAHLQANELVSWSETYFPTVTMDSVTLVNEHGAIHINPVAGDAERIVVKVFMTKPDSTFNLHTGLFGTTDFDIFDGEFTAHGESCSTFTFYTDDYSIPDGDYECVALVSDQSGTTLLEASLGITLPLPANGLELARQNRPKIIRMSQFLYKIEFSAPGERTLTVVTIDGKVADEQRVHNNSAYIRLQQTGLYLIRVMDAGKFYSVKVVVN